MTILVKWVIEESNKKHRNYLAKILRGQVQGVTDSKLVTMVVTTSWKDDQKLCKRGFTKEILRELEEMKKADG